MFFSKALCYPTNQSLTQFSLSVQWTKCESDGQIPTPPFSTDILPSQYMRALQIFFTPHWGKTCPCVLLIFHQDLSFHKWKDQETINSLSEKNRCAPFYLRQNNEASPTQKGELLSNWNYIYPMPQRQMVHLLTLLVFQNMILSDTAPPWNASETFGARVKNPYLLTFPQGYNITCPLETWLIKQSIPICV